jgi:hypothetical protein
VLQLSSTLASYINDARNATLELKKVAVEAGNLYALLSNLRSQVEEARSNDSRFNQVKRWEFLNGPLDLFKGILESMVKNCQHLGKRHNQISTIVKIH